jgi:hypothetical protein
MVSFGPAMRRRRLSSMQSQYHQHQLQLQQGFGQQHRRETPGMRRPHFIQVHSPILSESPPAASAVPSLGPGVQHFTMSPDALTTSSNASLRPPASGHEPMTAQQIKDEETTGEDISRFEKRIERMEDMMTKILQAVEKTG